MSQEESIKKTVLIVEDEPFLRELCLKKLDMLGYNTETAIDGKEALKKVKKIKPDLLLLDLIIPGFSGFEVIEKIRSNSDSKISGLPIVVLSNLGEQEDINKAAELGANEYLIKSNYTITEIIDKIQDYL